MCYEFIYVCIYVHAKMAPDVDVSFAGVACVVYLSSLAKCFTTISLHLTAVCVGKSRGMAARGDSGCR